MLIYKYNATLKQYKSAKRALTVYFMPPACLNDIYTHPRIATVLTEFGFNRVTFLLAPGDEDVTVVNKIARQNWSKATSIPPELATDSYLQQMDPYQNLNGWQQAEVPDDYLAKLEAFASNKPARRVTKSAGMSQLNRVQIAIIILLLLSIFQLYIDKMS